MGRAAGAGRVIGVLSGRRRRAHLEPLADLILALDRGAVARLTRAGFAARAAANRRDALVPMGYRDGARLRTYRCRAASRTTSRRRSSATCSSRRAPSRWCPRDGAEPAPRTSDPGRRPIRPRADALRRFAAEVSGRQDLDGLFDDVIDESFTLFGVDEAGLWTYDDSPTPLTLAAQRGLTREVLEIIATLPRDAPTAGMDGDASARGPDHARRPRPDDPGRPGDLSTRPGSGRSASSRSSSAASRSGCSCSTTTATTPWTADETELARAFADHMATAIGNARLASSTRTLAARLRVISELAGRLNHLQDVPRSPRRSSAETRQLIDYDTIRVYRVDHETGWCEPIAFQGMFRRGDPPMTSHASGSGSARA